MTDHITRFEALAFIWSLGHFHACLCARRFRWKMDHSVERIEVRVCGDFINLERADVALFIMDVCTALPV